MNHRTAGFTLVELMIAVLILAILMAAAVPSFRDFAANSRTSAASSDLTTALSLARSEAVRRSGTVIACASADLADCSDKNDWTTGWIVFADRNDDGDVDADELLQTWTGPKGGIVVLSNVDRAAYNTMGMAPDVGAGATFTVQKEGCSGDKARVSSLSLSGSVRSEKAACP